MFRNCDPPPLYATVTDAEGWPGLGGGHFIPQALFCSLAAGFFLCIGRKLKNQQTKTNTTILEHPRGRQQQTNTDNDQYTTNHNEKAKVAAVTRATPAKATTREATTAEPAAGATATTMKETGKTKTTVAPATKATERATTTKT